jgi:hypothetical protein
MLQAFWLKDPVYRFWVKILLLGTSIAYSGARRILVFDNFNEVLFSLQIMYQI